jgi:hypothetical protein
LKYLAANGGVLYIDRWLSDEGRSIIVVISMPESERAG